MDPIEKAIRTALEKGDADDPEFRQRVYRSVEAALDRVIQANPQLTVEKAISRRKGLQAKIQEIETEFQPAVASDEAALDEALLDFLEDMPEVKPANGGAMPEWPSAAGAPGPTGPEPEVERVAVPTPTPDPVGRQWPSGQFPAAPPPPAAERSPAAEPGGRREPSFSSVGRNPPPAAPAAPVPSVGEEGSRFSTPVPEVTISHGRRREPEPSVDFGAMPDLGAKQVDIDFPDALPPALDEPSISDPVPPSPPSVVAADRIARSRERRRPFAALFFGLALLSLAAAGLMFAFQTGLLKSPQERDTSVPNPAPELGSEDFDPSAGAPPALSDRPAEQQNWIAIFTPSDASTVSAPGDTTAEAMRDDTGDYLRIRSGASGSAVIFDVGREVLEQLSGRKAVFNISARAEGGASTEISIECNFGELGDCGRKRYEVGYERGEYLFEIDLPNEAPGANGTIAINSDFSGQGKAIDVYEIRAAAAAQ